MKTILNLILILLLGQANAQLASNQISEKLDSIKVIVLTLSGDVIINNSDENIISVHSTLTPSGSVIGWTYPKERPLFEIKSRISGDSLYIETPAVWDQKIIGIDLYSELIESTILLPNNKNIIIKRANDVEINTDIKNLKVSHANHLVWNNYNFSAHQLLMCDARDDLIIGGKRRSGEFESYGNGEGIVRINASSIHIK